MRSKNAKRKGAKRRKAIPLYKQIPLNGGFVYPFRKKVLRNTIVSSTTADTETNYTFKLSDLTDQTDYVNIFEEYRIRKVMVMMYPRANAAAPIVWNSTGVLGTSTFVNANGAACNYYAAIDFTDTTALGTLNAFLEQDTVRVRRSTDTLKLVFSPKLTGLEYTTTGNNYSTLPASTWLQTNSPSIPYYGLRTWVPTVSAIAGAVTIDVIATYWIEFRGIK